MLPHFQLRPATGQIHEIAPAAELPCGKETNTLFPYSIDSRNRPAFSCRRFSSRTLSRFFQPRHGVRIRGLPRLRSKFSARIIPWPTQLGPQLLRLTNTCWMADFKRLPFREPDQDFYADDYLLFPQAPAHLDHICPEVKKTYEPYFRRAVQALRTDKLRTAAKSRR